MSEIVHANPPELCLLQHPRENVPHIALLERGPLERGEHPFGHRLALLQPTGTLLPPPFDQRGEELRGDIDAARWCDFVEVSTARTRLRWTMMNRPCQSMSPHWSAICSPSRSPVLSVRGSTGATAGSARVRRRLGGRLRRGSAAGPRASARRRGAGAGRGAAPDWPGFSSSTACDNTALRVRAMPLTVFSRRPFLRQEMINSRASARLTAVSGRWPSSGRT